MKNFILKSKRWFIGNIEIFTGLIALIAIYLVCIPFLRIFYPVGAIPPEMIMKPIYVIYEIMMLHAGIWLLWKLTAKGFAYYFDTRDYKAGIDFFNDFSNLTQFQRCVIIVLFWSVYLLFAALILMAGVMN